MRVGPLLLAAAAAFAGCTCAKKETVVKTIDGPVSASLVQVDRAGVGIGGVGGGHVGIIFPVPEHSVECELHVTKPSQLEVGVEHGCGQGEMLVDPGGTRLAVGIPEGEHRLFYFGGDGRSFEAPKPVDAPVKWEAIADLKAALPSIFARALESEDASLRFMLSGGKGPPAKFGEPIVDEVLEGPGGSAELAKILLANAATTFHADERKTKYRDLWRRAFQRLAPAAAATLRAGLAEAARKPSPNPNTLARALQEDAIDWAQPTADEVLLARTRELVHAKGHDRMGEDVLSITFRRLVQTSPGPTAALACEHLTRWAPDSVLGAEIADDAGAAALALAVTKTRCAGVTKHFEEATSTTGYGLCTVGAWFCPESEDRKSTRARCSTADLAARARALAFVPWHQLKEKLGTIESLYVPALVYARVLGGAAPLPARLERGIERQTYAWKSPASPPCREAPPGVRCAPSWSFITHIEICVPEDEVKLGYDRREGILRWNDARRERWVDGDPAEDAGADETPARDE